MDYKIIKYFTENLNVSTFPDMSENAEKIELIINLNTNLTNINSDNNIFMFSVNYNIHSKNKPISLSWAGGCFLEFNDTPTDFDEQILLTDSNIKLFLNDIIKSFSLYLNGDLPDIDTILDSYD